MAKMFRLCRDRKRIQQGVGSRLKLSANVERILIFCVVIAFINHLMTCLWIMTTRLQEDLNWMTAYKLKLMQSNVVDLKFSDMQTYMIALYFVSTTVTTVGYGDINPVNDIERIFCIMLLFIGVMTFSFASGSLSSIITNYDNS